MRRVVQHELYRPRNPQRRPGLLLDFLQVACMTAAIGGAWFGIARPALEETAQVVDSRRAAVRSFAELAHDVDRVRGIGLSDEQFEAHFAERLALLRQAWSDAKIAPVLCPSLYESPVGPVLVLQDRSGPAVSAR
ncbi:MAG: hypothetical protein KDB80_03910 [Planctomycetes bacterium]|nr:hypothetical protein [Planctomycetota bacterium]